MIRITYQSFGAKRELILELEEAERIYDRLDGDPEVYSLHWEKI